MSNLHLGPPPDRPAQRACSEPRRSPSIPPPGQACTWPQSRFNVGAKCARWSLVIRARPLAKVAILREMGARQCSPSFGAQFGGIGNRREQADQSSFRIAELCGAVAPGHVPGLLHDFGEVLETGKFENDILDAEFENSGAVGRRLRAALTKKSDRLRPANGDHSAAKNNFGKDGGKSVGSFPGQRLVKADDSGNVGSDQAG